MTNIVIIIPKATNIARYMLWPNARYASSGPYDAELIASDPSPTHAKRAINDNLWKMLESNGSLASPIIILFNLSNNNWIFVLLLLSYFSDLTR